MSTMPRELLLQSIATTIADYRVGEIDPPTPDHVNRWVSQFRDDAQIPILSEVGHVLERSYFSQGNVISFLGEVAQNAKLVGNNAREFWRTAGLLNIQRRGSSQRKMLATFDRILQEKYGISIQECDATSGNFIYIDDAIFSGNRIKIDVASWLKDAPQELRLSVIVMGLHSGSIRYAENAMRAAANKLEKKFEVRWWRRIEIENRPWQRDTSEVLWPSRLPGDDLARAYVKMLTDAGHPPELRASGNMGKSRFFSSEEARDLLEQEFLEAGLRIRSECSNLIDFQRPLGNSVLQTLGFGALLITYRNCPNNCPLALWASDPWYPLFPRRAS